MCGYAVFVSSSDNYSDLWPLFFGFFKKFWPEYDGRIYLSTQRENYSYEGLNIICTNVGAKRHFGETFRAGLDRVDEDNVLLMMIDYLFMGRVDNNKVEEYFNLFVGHDFDSVYLCQQEFPNNERLKGTRILMPGPEYPCSRLFGYQMAFWKKSVLYEMALPHEDPWMSEWYGSKRAAKMNIKSGYLDSQDEMPIIYDGRGCLHQGKWLENAVEFIGSNGMPVDYGRRGMYDDKKGYLSLCFRIRTKWNICRTGFMGSYRDLHKRRPIH